MTIGAKLLLVEDDEPSRELMLRQMKRAGFDVTTARNVAEARQVIMENFDLVLMDLILPDGNGWELAREWKQSFKFAHIPIVALTGMVPAEEANVLCEFCDGYHMKPVQFSRLLITMNRLLASRKAVSQMGFEFTPSGS